MYKIQTKHNYSKCWKMFISFPVENSYYALSNSHSALENNCKLEQFQESINQQGCILVKKVFTMIINAIVQKYNSTASNLQGKTNT